MKKIEVFDPPLCCSTGVCGADIDQALVNFATDVEWVKQRGAHIDRFNLAQQPQAFADNRTVRAFLEKSGQDGLPLILMDGRQVLAGRYPSRDELAGWIGGNAGSAESALFTSQVAELVAIGAAIASNCESCFKYHYDAARKLGISTDDLRRAVDLAQKVRNTPARAMLELAERYLNPAASTDIDAKAASPGSVTCCGPASKAAESAKSGCC